MIIVTKVCLCCINCCTIYRSVDWINVKYGHMMFDVAVCFSSLSDIVCRMIVCICC